MGMATAEEPTTGTTADVAAAPAEPFAESGRTSAKAANTEAPTSPVSSGRSAERGSADLHCVRCMKEFPRSMFESKSGEQVVVVSDAANFRCPPCALVEASLHKVEALGDEVREHRVAALQPFEKLLLQLRAHPSAKPFLHPVDPQRARVLDYYLRVKDPMDLNLVKLRASKGYYESSEEMAKDVVRIFENAVAFNVPNSIVFRFAQECRAYWDQHYGQLQAQVSEGTLLTGRDARKRKTTSFKEAPGSAAASAPAAAGAEPRPRKRTAVGGAPVVGEAKGAPGEGKGVADKPVVTKSLSKGWVLEAIVEGQEAGDATLAGHQRVRKAKVRWEPEEITASERSKKAREGKHATASPAAPMQPPPPAVRKQRRPSGSTRCGLNGTPSHMSQWQPHISTAGVDGTLFPPTDLEQLCFRTPVPLQGALAQTLLQSAHHSFYDVAAAALPEIDVGDDLEGVAGDLDGLLEDVPIDAALGLCRQ